jgi:hypothetical protein
MVVVITGRTKTKIFPDAILKAGLLLVNTKTREKNGKPFFFLFSSNWRNLLWIDMICEAFLHDFSYRTFIDDIGFNQSITNLWLYDRYRSQMIRKAECKKDSNKQEEIIK